MCVQGETKNLNILINKGDEMCIECEYIGEIHEVMDKFTKKGELSNSDVLERMTSICLRYWKEVAEDKD